MGKLYDEKDLEFELSEIDQAEVDAQRSLTPFALAALDGKVTTYRDKKNKLQHWERGNTWDKIRRGCKMKLLKTGQIMGDWRFALGLFNKCPHCTFSSDGHRRPCKAHSTILFLAGRRLKYAADENEPLRRRQGRPWGEDEETPEDTECNKWEQWYFKDRREGVWPGLTTDARAYNLEQFGSLDYRGWLQMMRYDAEEISESEYRSELNRLKGA